MPSAVRAYIAVFPKLKCGQKQLRRVCPVCGLYGADEKKYPPENRLRGVGAFPAICEPNSRNGKERKKVQADSKDAIRLNLIVQQQ